MLRVDPPDECKLADTWELLKRLQPLPMSSSSTERSSCLDACGGVIKYSVACADSHEFSAYIRESPACKISSSVKDSGNADPNLTQMSQNERNLSALCWSLGPGVSQSIQRDTTDRHHNNQLNRRPVFVDIHVIFWQPTQGVTFERSTPERLHTRAILAIFIFFMLMFKKREENFYCSLATIEHCCIATFNRGTWWYILRGHSCHKVKGGSGKHMEV